tara:strand:+ start:88412 stop:89386 length:975 start_codon:yes stop_codon:yes gene_type:complete
LNKILIQLKSSFKVLIPLAIGIFFIYLTVNTTTSEDRRVIFSYIKDADFRFIILSILFGILSHLSRAYRWKFLLTPIGYKPSFINLVLAVLVGYVANLGIPRSGEILRATTLSTYEKIPFEKSFGTVIAERLVDMILLLGFILLALGLQFDLIMEVLKEKELSTKIIIALSILIIVFFFILRPILKNNQSKPIIKVKIFFQGLVEGILSIKSMPKKAAFVFHTLFIWTMYVAMFYVIKWAVPETESLGLNALLPAFVIGGLTISATNGGIGIYPFSVALMLSAFGISKESGLAFGWIVWSSQTFMILIFGGLSFFTLPLVNRKN